MRLATILAGWLLLASAAQAPAQAPDKGWRAGAAKAAITPAAPMWMSGYAARDHPAEGADQDLWAKALALEDAGGKKAVLVTLDLVGINRELSQSICRRLGDQYGLDRGGIMLTVSHTHCGPVVGRNLRSMYFLDKEQSRLVDDYTRGLEEKVVGVVGQAIENLAPAEVTAGDGFVTFATNRRNNDQSAAAELRRLGKLKGPVDHQVPVLVVRDPAGTVRAVAFGYACHATTLAYYRWSGDYPGYAVAALEKMYPDAVALFWAGCGGDQNPLPRQTVALARKYGEELAGGVADVINAPMKPLAPALKTTYREVALALAELPSREALVEQTMDKNKYIAARAQMLLDRLKTGGDLPKTYPYPVQVWQLGDLTWVALGGEVTVEYALRLKRELGPLWVTGYANDVMAYIPSLKVLREGGYEGATSMVYYGLPTVWSPRVEETIVAAVREQVAAARGKKD